MTQSNDSFFSRYKIIYWAAVLIIAALGAVIRFYDLTDLPLDFNATRQLHSALIARGMYYQNLDSAPQWQRDMAVNAWMDEGLIEPQIMERLAAFSYQILGGEKLWLPRVYSILFWLAGSLGLFLLAREISGKDGAVTALLYFLLLPFGAIASRVFMPDPLMVTLIIYAWWALARWHAAPTWKWTILAGILAGLAIYSKSVAVFFILFPFAGVVLTHQKFTDTLKDKKVWVMGVLAVVPYALYHFYGTAVLHLLQSQFSMRFFPQLWKDPVFYLHWKEMINGAVGFHWVIVAVVGTFAIRQKSFRGLLLGAWVGYFLYGMTFAYHIQSHDYYQLPLIPLVALGLAGAADLVLRNLKGPALLVYPLVGGILLFSAATTAWNVRCTLKANDYRHEEIIWQTAGEDLGHDTKVVGLTHDYGYRLLYWGWVDETTWKTSSDMSYRELAGQTFDDFDSQFAHAVEGADFFIVTLFGELESQPALKAALYNTYPIYKDAGDYLIFDLRDSLPKQ